MSAGLKQLRNMLRGIKTKSAGKASSEQSLQHPESLIVTHRDDLTKLFFGEAENHRLYAPDLVQAGVPAHVQKEVSRWTEMYGAVTEVRPIAARHEIIFQRAVMRLTTERDSCGRFTSMLAHQPGARGSFQDIASRIASLSGETALYVETDGLTRWEHNAAVPLAVGSAFKLVVLAALTRSGKTPSSTMLEIRSDRKSLPSGILQDWPDHVALSVETLANLMISVSDNTATDMLIEVLGRDALETISPRNRPFLTTREAFLLKRRSEPRLRASWEKADEVERREMLAALAHMPPPAAHDLLATPTIGIEWFMTARELADLLKHLSGHPALSINPGPLTASDWQSYAYKGGSEAGVINFTLEVLGFDGRRHIVVITWNNSSGAVDLNQLLFLTQGLLNQL